MNELLRALQLWVSSDDRCRETLNVVLLAIIRPTVLGELLCLLVVCYNLHLIAVFESCCGWKGMLQHHRVYWKVSLQRCAQQPFSTSLYNRLAGALNKAPQAAQATLESLKGPHQCATYCPELYAGYRYIDLSVCPLPSTVDPPTLTDACPCRPFACRCIALLSALVDTTP